MDCWVPQPHIDSYNYFADDGIRRAVNDVAPEKFRLASGEAVEMRLSGASVGLPCSSSTSGRTTSILEGMKILPAECRQRGTTYKAPLKAQLHVAVDGRSVMDSERLIGEVPVMLRSRHCHLHQLDAKQMVRAGEEATEFGGYFVVNGSEKVVRTLVFMRRNFPVAMVRPRYRDRGPMFSEYACAMRNVKDSHSATLMTLHYLESGTMTMCCSFQKQMFYIPLACLLRALTDADDRTLHALLTRGRDDDQFWNDCVANMLRAAQQDGLHTQELAQKRIGEKFRVAITDYVAPWEDDGAACRVLLTHSVAIHLSDFTAKLHCLIFMAQKLIALVQNHAAEESPDNPMFQEAGLSGHMLLMLTKERVEAWLNRGRKELERLASRKSVTASGQFSVTSVSLARAFSSSTCTQFTRSLEFFLATGNLVSKSGLAMPQTTGYSVIAERINFLRFTSHFRAIHRGSFFMEMRTTDVRKLRPEAWGFICPVHTPDGSPCGLLNHITASCQAVATPTTSKKGLFRLLGRLGLIPLDGDPLALVTPTDRLYPVYFDGQFLGHVKERDAESIANSLRLAKVLSHAGRIADKDVRVPDTMEISLVPFSPDPKTIRNLHPGLYLFAEAGRLVRPVRHLATGCTELIGTFEQVFLSVCIDPEEAIEGVTRHQELSPTALFSFAANLIPYPDHNQSPRNVYQCQMGKQTMGTPVHAWQFRSDNKMYRIQSPQTPLVKPEAYDKYNVDEYPLGTNAIVAVISYTGYDMEDAMAINRASWERGFAHGCVIKNERINLRDARGPPKKECFRRDPNQPDLHMYMDADGLPLIGKLYSEGTPMMCIYDMETGKHVVKKFKYAEPAYAILVRLIRAENDSATGDPPTHALIQWRITRNPTIGDKFASRHGQKGINSFLWPVESLPFTEGGMVPDILFNPHGFPSRMTIGMMIESMAGKAAAHHAWKQDASPFLFNEEMTAIDYFGEMLTKAGYNYYGNEVMYSGVDGREFEVQIFIGVIYYQRLRHMIADKYQVRATGPIDAVTHQPVKGRKRAGGIRFGEMERDGLIAHGASFCLIDRLFNCSDKDIAEVCALCGSMVSVVNTPSMDDKTPSAVNSGYRDRTRRSYCLHCRRADYIRRVEMPFVFRYLCNELASMNIKVKLLLE